MAQYRQFQSTVESGWLPPDVVSRLDADLRNRGLRSAKNILITGGGSWRRRPGTARLTGLTGQTVVRQVGIGPGDVRLLAFYSGGVTIYSQTGTVDQTILGAPWVGADLDGLSIAIQNNLCVIASRSFAPRVLQRSDAGVWSLSLFTFATGSAGRTLQPYFRFAPRGMTITPSGSSGSINLTTSSAYWTAAYVGTRVRYLGVEILITSYTSPTVVVGTVNGALYPTFQLTVATTSGFAVGEQVEGSETKVQAQVTSIDSGTTMTVVLTGGFQPFSTTAPIDAIIGPNQRSVLSAATGVAQATTVEWDEQVIGTAKGYPGVAAFHRTRLFFAGFALAQSLICGSGTEDITNFDTGTGLDDEAIIVLLGRETSQLILNFASTEQLLVFTEGGSFYVPEVASQAISPTSVEFLEIGPEACSTALPAKVTEGVMVTHRDTGRLLICLPTGNVRRSWDMADVSELGYHLLRDIREIEVFYIDAPNNVTDPANQGYSSDTDRLVVCLRSDGKLAVMRNKRGQDFAGWVLWETQGEFYSIEAVEGKLFAVVKRTVGGIDRWWLEVFDQETLLDGKTVYPTVASTNADYASAEVTVALTTQSLGLVTTTPSGGLGGAVSSPGAVDVGFDFAVEAFYLTPMVSELGRLSPLRVMQVEVNTIQTGRYKINNQILGGYQTGDDESLPYPLRTTSRGVYLLGRSRDDGFRITQDEASPLYVRDVTMDVKTN